ncbi:nuclease-related domain-containing DEAD/DEAH box helicase [Bordetella petrii]|uniref:nuclease-related domain-containing DEAD/DEAH box helicase n=1 Tax=Bordetella petrii TaxID=94624 RepID=UPI001A96A41D|nr:NERD domain-containing protein [Bordetella petrii]MBO1111839.1 NERD domain-containing protein [Bordetella petrii]
MIGPVTQDKWEREVRRQLERQLPDEWIVVCNVSWAIESGGYVRDGQSDFVVLAPDLGMAIVEVKGSRSVRVGEDGVWYRQEQNTRTGEVGAEIKIEKAPPEQACGNMHTLAGVVSKGLGSATFPGAYTFLVAYPNGVVKGRSDLYDQSTIISHDKMGRLGPCIKSSLMARGAERSGRNFSADTAKRASIILGNLGFSVESIDSGADAREDTDNIEKLTRQQYAALKGAFELPSVAIIGPAGSGKTTLAIWKLSSLLEEGRRAIYVCFNKALADDLRRKNHLLEQAIVNVDKLFTKVAKPNGSLQKDAHYFRELLPRMVVANQGDMMEDERYEAIVVDEGQDFGEERLLALYGLLRDGGQWLFFADWQQDIYRAGSGDETLAEVIFKLYHNCRNTELINEATNQYCDSDVKAMPGVPRGVLPQVLRCEPGIMGAKAWELVHELSPEGGAVILSPYILEKSCLSTMSRGYGLQLTEDIEKLNKPGYVFFSTIKAFKGLEAGHVILIHADRPDKGPALTLNDLYVACTRATGRFTIVTSSEEAYRWFCRQ